MKAKKLVSLLLAGMMLCGIFSGCSVLEEGGSEDQEDTVERTEDTRDITDNEYTLLNLSGTDALGREFTSADSEDKELYVGMFFYLTLGYHSDHDGIYDVTQITNYGANLDAFYYTDDATSPVGSAHFWGEPVWGYYRSDDEWVIRRQMEMLTCAGMDYLCFDVSNAVLYLDTVNIILEVLQEYYDQGWDVPKFMFYVAASDTAVIEELYDTYYSKGLYEDLWFAPSGKPLITEYYSTTWDETDSTEYAISEFFDFRYRQWPNESFLRKGWSWMEFEYPQPVHTDMINVSAAQHTSLKFSETTDNWGKGFDRSTMTNDSSLVDSGANYASEWETVLSGDSSDQIQYVMLTQWNEWVFTKFWDSSEGKAYSVDGFNAEYNRDMEPVKNAYGDNYYMQTIQNVREWKYTDPVHYTYDPVTVDIADFSESQWDGASVYLDFTNEIMERDSYSFDGSYPIQDDSNRNDIASVSVLRDSSYIYFRIETLDDITEYEDGDTGWMNILIKTNGGGDDDLMGYQYCLNRSVSLDTNSASVSKRSGSSWEAVSHADLYTEGNVLQMRVALEDIGMTSTDYYMEFKVTDNVSKTSDPLSFFLYGDCAPIGRLSYTYGY